MLAAVSFGTGDFGGALASRRAPVLGVVLTVQLAGFAVALLATGLVGEGLPPGTDAVYAALAGIVGAFGIVALYRGLAEGRMGVVAPIAGVLAAVIPVSVGAALDGLPSPAVALGIGLALVAVGLVSSAPSEDGRPSGLAFALAAGLGLGAFNVLISRVTPGTVFGAVAVLRLAEVLAIGVLILASRRAWRLPRRLVPAVIGVAALDTAGNVFYILATQTGRLDIAATTSSLYPVVTLVLAVALLGERVSRPHALGVVTAVVSIVLITMGTGP
jgi:drug/metabolite transporter (DMT)-like permease